MTLTGKQAYILANIDRVIPLPGKIIVSSPRPRYQLDGNECTAQITSLIVKRFIAKHAHGGFQRLGTARVRDKAVGERQPPLARSLEAIRASLFAP